MQVSGFMPKLNAGGTAWEPNAWENANAATPMGSGVLVTGPVSYISGISGTKTYQASGRTTAGAGAATIQIEGSNNAGVSWDVIGTINLVLSASGGVNDASDGFTSDDRYLRIRANVTALSGTNAQVSVRVGA
jgi:hypothetical protein